MDIKHRRRTGAFFTPRLFVDLAHEYIAKAFGENWKEEYVVWDCCCGTGNLTRDYKFKELYMSTLEESDINTANQMGYNPEAVKFQYDFLNDGVGEDLFDESALPEGLAKAISEGKKILFFINPPYAAAGKRGEAGDKEGVSATAASGRMKKEKWGGCTKQLYAQFLYNIWRFNDINKNVKVAVFSKPMFMSGGSFEDFRTRFFSSFGIKNGFLFAATHFSDCAKGWGVSFTVFDNAGNDNKFVLDIIDLDEKFDVQKVGEKEIYNTDNKKPASEWVRTGLKNIKKKDAPQISSATKTNDRRKLGFEGQIGSINNHANSVYDNSLNVFIASSTTTKNSNVPVLAENFDKVMTLFAARRTITGQYANWINDKDEYLAPNESHPEWAQFVTDSLVYSLFNNASQQSALRQIEYKGKLWDIKNEFFWLSKNDIMKLANDSRYDGLYKDAKTSDERFVYKKLFGAENVYGKLSEDAKAVLDSATALVKKSIERRKELAREHPEYHLDSFDAGYAQLKLVWKEYFKEEFEAFRDLYKAFENRLRPLVHKLGFLK